MLHSTCSHKLLTAPLRLLESDIEHDGEVSDIAEETDEEKEEQQVEDKDDVTKMVLS